MNNLPNCPKCNSEYVYEDGALLVCPECAYEWNPAEVADVEEGLVAIDANGNKLADGDTVTLIKDLKVKVRQRFETRDAREKYSHRRRRPQYRL